MSEARYFLAILPDARTSAEVTKLKEYCQQKYDTNAALRSPPHITLHMPFHWKSQGETRLVDTLQKFASTQTGFKVGLTGFGCFVPRVIFVSVEESEHLKRCQQQLDRFCKVNLNLFDASYRDQPFHPHITIAFRDLKKATFPKAWDDFNGRSFEGGFLCESFWLLRHDGIRWHPHHELKFG